MSNFVAWRDGQNARDQIHDIPQGEQLVLLVQNGTIKQQLATLVRTRAKHSNLKMRNWSTAFLG